VFALFILLCGSLIFDKKTQTEAVHVSIAEKVLIVWFCLAVILSLANMVVNFKRSQESGDEDEERVEKISKVYRRGNTNIMTAEFEGVTMTNNPTTQELAPKMKL
jgi:hypothetical protein